MSSAIDFPMLDPPSERNWPVSFFPSDRQYLFSTSYEFGDFPFRRADDSPRPESPLFDRRQFRLRSSSQRRRFSSSELLLHFSYSIFFVQTPLFIRFMVFRKVY